MSTQPALPLDDPPCPPDVQPRYWAYVLAQGCGSVEEMQRQDRERWPGGLMAGYVLWVSGEGK